MQRPQPVQFEQQRQTPEMREPITSGTRSNLVDIVKGIAIILVTYEHTAQGVVHRGWWTVPGYFFSRALIYSFHMPAFFFVAGLFVHRSIERRGGLPFTVEKMKSILYPYLLFTVIMAALQPLIGRFEMSAAPFHWGQFLLNLTDGNASWFLFTLFFCFMLALVTARVPGWLLFVAAVLVGMTPAFGPPLTNQVLREFCFVAAGMLVGVHIFRVDRMRNVTAGIGLVVLAGFQIAMIYRYGAANRWSYAVLGLTGTAALFLLAKLLDRHRIGDGFAWIGRASLAIFLLSAFAQGATRAVLSGVFHTQELWLQLLLPTACATLLPAIVWHQQRRLRLGWLFYWPF
jgi:fucose 4-O-acetylase-like acetyltransferase